MKSLFTMRQEDGRLVRWNGASWSVVGTYTPPDWPDNNDQAYRNYGCFVYRGKLHTRFFHFDKSVSATYPSGKISVGVYDGSDVTLLATVGQTNLSNSQKHRVYEFWGEVFEYKGRIYWFSPVSNGWIEDGTGSYDSDHNYMFLYCFYYDDNGDPVLVRHRCTELGQFQNMYNERNRDSGVWMGKPVWSCRVRDCFDRLMISPGTALAGYNGSGTHVHKWTYNCKIDIDETHNVSAAALPVLNPYGTSRLAYVWRDSGELNTNWDKYDPTKLHNVVYADTVAFKDKLYGITIGGDFYEVDPDTGVKTFKWSLAETGVWEIVPGRTWSTQRLGGTPNADHVMAFYTSQDGANWTNNNGWGFPWRRGGWSMVTIEFLNFNGVAGNRQIGYIWGVYETSSSYSIKPIMADGTFAPAQPAGVQFKLHWNFDQKGTAQGSDWNWALRHAHFFVFDGKLHLFLGSSRRWDDTNDANLQEHSPPWGLIVWDGVNPPTATRYTNGSGVWAATTMSFNLDEGSGTLHILYRDTAGQNVKHASINLTTLTLTDNGSPCAYTSASNRERAGMPVDTAALFDSGDVTATIDSRTLDRDNAKITMAYKLWSANSDTADITVEYNVGEGWFTATRKGAEGDAKTGLTSSPTGTAHTFVHDLAADLGASFNGTIQHRVGVASQSRN